jgi:acyl-CoA thioesterase FadM
MNIMARIKLTIPGKRIFTATIPVRITDINYGDHVGNDALVSILHETRMQWLASGDFTELDTGGAALIMSDLAVEYKAESFYGDRLLVSLATDDIQKISFDIYYEVSVQRGEKMIIIAKAKTGMVSYNYEMKKTVALPEAFLKFIS